MSATLHKTKLQNMGEWVRIFPKQVTESYSSSATFMKQLSVVAISTIAYMKNLFPHNDFTTEHFGGVRLRILKRDCEHELAQFISAALVQAFEAFDKKYLQQMAICFYDGECTEQNLVEYHIFEYSYLTDGMSMTVQSKTQNKVEHSTRFSFDYVKERTMHLIRACVVLMETCRDELPAACDVSLRLYYNKDAPSGYQAPGFQRPDEARDPLLAARRLAVKLGCVDTPFHRVTPRSYVRHCALSDEPGADSNGELTPMSSYEEEFRGFPSQKSTVTPVKYRIQSPCNSSRSYCSLSEPEHIYSAGALGSSPSLEYMETTISNPTHENVELQDMLVSKGLSLTTGQTRYTDDKFVHKLGKRKLNFEESGVKTKRAKVCS